MKPPRAVHRAPRYRRSQGPAALLAGALATAVTGALAATGAVSDPPARSGADRWSADTTVGQLAGFTPGRCPTGPADAGPGSVALVTTRVGVAEAADPRPAKPKIIYVRDPLRNPLQDPPQGSAGACLSKLCECPPPLGSHHWRGERVALRAPAPASCR